VDQVVENQIIAIGSATSAQGAKIVE
jgi:hypothetical protein